MKQRRAELALAFVTILWGTTFVVVKSALDDVSTILFLTLRFALASAALVAIFGRDVRKQALAAGIAAGSLLFAAYVFQTLGLESTSPSKSAFLTGLSIPLVPLVGSLVYRTKPRLFELAGILVASAGMALMTFPSGQFTMDRGDLLSLLCAVTFALHMVLIGHYSPLFGFESLAVFQVATAAALGLFFVGFAEPVKLHLTPQLAVAVVLTGLLATALAFTVMAWAQQYTSATRAALIFTLEPVVAWLTSFFLTGERMSGRGEMGAVLILAGILIVELKRTKEPEHLTVRSSRGDV